MRVRILLEYRGTVSVCAWRTCHGRFIALHTFTSPFPVTGLPNRIGITAYRNSREISTGLNKSAERALTPGFTALDIYRVTVGFLGKALAVIWLVRIDFRPRLFFRLARSRARTSDRNTLISVCVSS